MHISLNHNLKLSFGTRFNQTVWVEVLKRDNQGKVSDEDKKELKNIYAYQNGANCALESSKKCEPELHYYNDKFYVSTPRHDVVEKLGNAIPTRQQVAQAFTRLEAMPTLTRVKAEHHKNQSQQARKAILDGAEDLKFLLSL